mmetsp:Transcript_63043/g.136937  ORF Transcript_63043/g.136937 Transcript_63043/m.136937 type:complete len:222 (+) Transcript_63043:936-1601(+)
MGVPPLCFKLAGASHRSKRRRPRLEGDDQTLEVVLDAEVRNCTGESVLVHCHLVGTILLPNPGHASDLHGHCAVVVGSILGASSVEVVAHGTPNIDLALDGHAGRAVRTAAAAPHRCEAWLPAEALHGSRGLLDQSRGWCSEAESIEAQLPSLVVSPGKQDPLLGEGQAVLGATSDLHDDLAPQCIRDGGRLHFLVFGTATKLAISVGATPAIDNALIGEK